MCRRFLFFLFLAVIGVAAGFVWFIHEAVPPYVFPDPKMISAREARDAQDRIEQALGLIPHSPPKTGAAANSGTAGVDPAQGPGQTITIHLSEDDINTTLATNPDIKEQMAAHGIRAAQLAFAPPNLVTAFVK